MRARLALAAVAATATGALVVASSPASAAGTAQFFYASKTSNGALVKVKVVGGEITDTTPLDKPHAGDNNVPQSTKGKFVAGVVRSISGPDTLQGLFTYNKDTDKLHPLTDSASSYVAGAALYGKNKVAFAQRKAWDAGRSKIRTVRAGGGTPSTLLAVGKRWTVDSIDTTASGRKIFFSAHDNTDICKVFKFVRGHASATAVKKFTSCIQLYVALSPDNDTLAAGFYTGAIPDQHAVHFVKVATGGVSKSIEYAGVPNQFTWVNNTKVAFDDQVAQGWHFAKTTRGKATNADFNSTKGYTSPVHI